ncbi:MAG: exonuclease domain-containing protein [Bdellovibrionaceae bacterium]|nr:exonuclease domain-containing protein [Pseudobdellovibrionaceae bacterium]
MLQTSWNDLTFVGFDTETTGKYPLTAEICEIAGVKWRGGKVVDTFSTLIKPTRPMGEAVIKIHGITNEMVADAPTMPEKIEEFHRFLQGAIPIAHHAPFDLGFIAVEFERAGLALPGEPVICSSLLSRRLIPESGNHRLQTLIGFLQLEQGAAHRAHDDAKACLEVALKCMERLVPGASLADVLAAQGGALDWSRFSMRELENKDSVRALIQATREERDVDFVYEAGSRPGQTRRIRPVGVVRSLDGDFFVGIEAGDTQSKRFFLDKVSTSSK